MKKDRWNQDRSFPRDWKVTNERLVVRGEFLLDLDWVKKWPEELEYMPKLIGGGADPNIMDVVLQQYAPEEDTFTLSFFTLIHQLKISSL